MEGDIIKYIPVLDNIFIFLLIYAHLRAALPGIVIKLVTKNNVSSRSTRKKTKMCRKEPGLNVGENFYTRAPDNFLKQGVADASFETRGVFLQNPDVFSLPSFYTRAFIEVGNIV